MAFEPKKRIANYFRKKKPLSIIFDALFVLIVLLLLIPGTRKETAAFFIRWTSFPASSLDEHAQYLTSPETRSWKLYDQEGKRVLFGDLNQKTVFLNVWATWCPPCIAELPGIAKLHDEFSSEVNFILVSHEDPEIVRKWLGKNGYRDLPVYYAAYSPGDFASQSIPATFIVDRQGKVILKKLGAARWNTDKTKGLLKQLSEQ